MFSRRSFFLLAGPALVLPRLAHAQNAASPYLGTWKWIGGARERALVDAAADASTEEMNIVVRGLARKMLKDRTVIPKRINMYESQKGLAIDYGTSVIEAPLTGKLLPWTNEHGDKVKVRHKISWGGRLLQQIKEARGQRTNVFVLSKDGARMTQYATITSERMPGDMEFRLTFRRS